MSTTPSPDLALVCTMEKHPVFPGEVRTLGPIETVAGARARLFALQSAYPGAAVYRLTRAEKEGAPEVVSQIRDLETQLQNARSALLKVLEQYGCGAPPEVTAALFGQGQPNYDQKK
ncbi:MAG TPA: hypothetical protein VFO27_16365 [Bryobacteraceae bacterium]|nr:hypothetical protein [Bryobacteraceae bacterium]